MNTNSLYAPAIGTHIRAAEGVEAAYAAAMRLADRGSKAEAAAGAQRALGWDTALTESAKHVDAANTFAATHTREVLNARDVVTSAGAGTPAAFLLGKHASVAEARAAAQAILEENLGRDGFWFERGLAENQRIAPDDPARGDIMALTRQIGKDKADEFFAYALAARHEYAKLVALAALAGVVRPERAIEAANAVQVGPDGKPLSRAELERLLHDVADVPRPTRR